MDYDRWLWGKSEPFCSLSRHMMAVGACVMEYLGAASSKGILMRLSEWMGLDEYETIHTFGYIASAHDIGKANPGFQPYSGVREGTYRVLNYRHEQYGATRLKTMWKSRGWPRRQISLLTAVIRVHHQGKGMGYSEKPVSAEWMALQDSLETRMWTLFKPVEKLPAFENADALGVLLSAVLILCDWVASSEGFGAEALPELEDVELLGALRVRAHQVLGQYGLIDGEACAYPRKTSFSALFPAIPIHGMRPLQAACETVGDRPAMLTIIEAPMGEGKTEAALYMAGRLCETFDKRGIYMALPTAATSNQMVDRVRHMLEAHQSGKARLLHSMAWLIDDQSLPAEAFETDDAPSAEDWLRPLRRGMLSGNAVGTVDQAMAAALRIKYGFLRLAGLENKVLIIDEIHAYDLFMSTIIARLLEWCRVMRIPVILLSATMQAQQKRKYLACYGIRDVKTENAYPLITQVSEARQVRETKITNVYMRGSFRFIPRPLGSDSAAVAEYAIERASGGGCICVMLNTVRQAQAVYRELKRRGETQVMLFHARFTAKRRAEIEEQCIKVFGKGGARPERMILVCTQVVEQSLDVDFDAMITQLAPMDLLLQRAGRVHRHGDNRRPAGMERPEIDVIVPEPSSTMDVDKRFRQIGGVYRPSVMKSTEQLLGQGRTVLVPEDVRVCVEEAYKDISDQEPNEAIQEMMKDMYSVTSAEGVLLVSPETDEFFAETPSVANSLSLTDSNEDTFLHSARTRENDNSQRFAFLPKDFPESDGSRRWLKQVMEYSCSCPVKKHAMEARKEGEKWNKGLTKQQGAGIIGNNKGKGNNIKECILLREGGDGLYHGQDYTFSCSDEYGVEEVSE
ncbi:MAG: CRISPR-associated helicase Cas3' [Clostridia bacterium]|nr:CRISPR-associated helicase Cas3' [Clostridia bacterium]